MFRSKETTRFGFVLEVFLLFYIVVSFLAIVPQFERFGKYNFLLEIIRSFPHLVVPGFFVAAVTGGIFWKSGKPKRGAALVLASVLALWCFVAPLSVFFSSVSHAAVITKGPAFRLLIANVEFGTADMSAFQAQLDREKPDLVFISEFTAGWMAAMRLRNDFPFSIEFPGRAAEGTALYSKFPLSGPAKSDSLPGFTSIITSVNVAGRRIEFFGIHAPPPTVDYTLAIRGFFFDALAQLIQRTGKRSIVVAGDFNTSPSATQYQKLIESTGLRNAAEGLGLPFTWVVKALPIFRAFIDYALVTGDIRSERVESLESFGSDHLPVIMEFRLSET